MYFKSYLEQFKDKKIKIFVDMDGTLAAWNEVGSKTLYDEGYYLNLPPHENMLKAIKEIAKEETKEVYVLTAVLTDSKYALAEKEMWLDKYLPEVPAENRIYVPYGKKKSEYLIENYSPITENDLLIDDYSKNLFEFINVIDSEDRKLCGLKVLNGINGNNGSWERINGNTVSIFADEKNIIEAINKTLKKESSRAKLPQLEKGFIKNGNSTSDIEIKPGGFNKNRYMFGKSR